MRRYPSHARTVPLEFSPYGFYTQWIIILLKCSSEQVRMIKCIMVNDVLHSVASDWVNQVQFEAADRETLVLLEMNWIEYEEYFAGIIKFLIAINPTK